MKVFPRLMEMLLVALKKMTDKLCLISLVFWYFAKASFGQDSETCEKV
jgi:hypothetical protein